MKINQYFKKSLSRQFIALIGVFILFFLVGTAIIYLTQQQLNNKYFEERAELVKKERILVEIDQSLNIALFDARGYVAFGSESLKSSTFAQHPEIRKLYKDLEKTSTTDEDKTFLKELREFTDYYFIETFPKAVRYFEMGQKDKVTEIANNGATERINEFQDLLTKEINSINKQLDGKVLQLTNNQSLVQTAFILFILLILFIFFVIIRIMVKNVGAPLSEFAFAANEIAKGNDGIIKVDSNRDDELGALSVAFKKMINSVQEKEQDLLAQNEELIAQQDELQAQQTELEEVLEAIQENEQKLEQRNELTNTISNSLNKQEVLDSIVINMSRIIEADKGLILMLNEDTYASFGVSKLGVKQFKDNLKSGLNERLIIFKKPFTIKREMVAEEKGFHQLVGFSYDLYIPVLSSTNEVSAILVFSRLSGAFAEKSMDEYEALAKQIGISLDKISMYEQTETARELNQNILNTIQEGIQLVDTDGTILQVNKQLCDMFQSGLDLVGQPLKYWIQVATETMEGGEEFFHFINRAISNDAILDKETFTFKRKTENKVFKVYSEGLYEGDKRVGTVVVYRDITKEFEVDQMKSEFVSTVSHELRTPLASILGFTELLINRQLKPDRQQKYLSTIYNETKRLTALINDFLDVQRMESGKQTYEKKYVELSPIIHKVIGNLQINTNVHHITFTPLTENDYILGDRSKIEQVFTNVISNAIKYSPNGGDIHVKMYEKEGQLTVDVEDHGLGIPEEALTKVFSKFYRIDNSDRRKIGGTGLGLAIVQEIMRSHEGEVNVSSKYGEGSIFTLTFPIVEGKRKETDTEKRNIHSGYKIFVIEDDKSLGELITQELLDSGFKVQHFIRGLEALEVMTREIPDAIVLDIMLEEDSIDGWSIMDQLKSDEQLKNIPIIVSTALDEKEKGFSLGAIDFLVKPYKPSQLSRAIMQTLLNIGKEGQILVPQEQEK
ncbi:ATP-binding protein [Bacillus sp. 31A1R]|uniref:histidine kinase n=1 Tax=Robertmurraya mangrovi TaxID=3098077 RepID=A0ABU5J3J4_9BACI|nr:ATP-binding protein [Bacillus sp. 31A1R]MDZ5473974.1 ATP-binding protein [Bacillus sp. 31A1R]